MNSLKLVLGLAAALMITQSRAADRYWVTKSGTKYHLAKSCPGLKKAKAVTDVSLSAVRSKKLTLCDLCKERAKKQKTKSTSGN